jgi:hypothetical protein
LEILCFFEESKLVRFENYLTCFILHIVIGKTASRSSPVFDGGPSSLNSEYEAETMTSDAKNDMGKAAGVKTDLHTQPISANSIPKEAASESCQSYLASGGQGEIIVFKKFFLFI